MITAAHQPSEPSVVGGLPPDEADRLAALARYEVLDTPPEPAFDRIVRLAALLLDVPIALISLSTPAGNGLRLGTGSTCGKRRALSPSAIMRCAAPAFW